jgi:hypothetical protein
LEKYRQVDSIPDFGQGCIAAFALDSWDDSYHSQLCQADFARRGLGVRPPLGLPFPIRVILRMTFCLLFKAVTIKSDRPIY